MAGERIEGGGPNPPFQESIFEKLVEVHWAAGAFVAGDFTGQIWYSKDGIKWVPVIYNGFLVPNGEITTTSAGKIASGKTVYIMGGLAFDDAGNQNHHAATSTDGKTWKKAVVPSPYTVTNHQQTQLIFGSFYDRKTKTFFLEGQFNDISLPPDSHGNSFSRDLVWKSTDGIKFSLISDQQTGPGEGFTAKLKDYDGIIATDKDGKGTAAPHDFSVFLGAATRSTVSPPFNTVYLGVPLKTVTTIDGDQTVNYKGTGTPIDSTLQVVNGVAQLGNTFVAVGEDAGFFIAGISVSTDKGKTWKKVVSVHNVLMSAVSAA